MIGKPKIIIADEPTGNLDSQNSQELLEIFQRLNHDDHVTIIMVSHDPMIASYSSRMIYIQDGRIKHELKRENLLQDEYFQRIVDFNSRISRGLLKDVYSSNQSNEG